MIRLHVTAEGQTEQRFVNNVLMPHLAQFNVFIDARCVLTSKDTRATKEYRGGIASYAKARKDIQSWLKEDTDPDCYFTTMFDLYALPNDFPGFEEAMQKTDGYERVCVLEEKMNEDLQDRRFISYIQLHEFEALILAEPQQLDWEYLDHEIPIKRLIDMVGTHNPELINGNKKTAPSKRILQEIPEYDKATAGVSVAKKIGLMTLRNRCQHFNKWLSRLESLTASKYE